MSAKYKIPLEMSEILEIYQEKNDGNLKPRTISYKDSTLKGKEFVNFCSNLELTGLVDFEGVPVEDIFELIKEVMNSSSVVNLYDVAMEIGQIILLFRQTPDYEILHNHSNILTPEQRQEFIQDNFDTVWNWNVYLSSMLVYYNVILRTNVCTKESLLAEGFGYIDRADAVGNTIVLLIKEQEYMQAHFSTKVDPRELMYFSQWDEPIKGTEFLYTHVAVEDNILFQTAVYEAYKDDPRFSNKPNIEGEA